MTWDCVFQLCISIIYLWGCLAQESCDSCDCSISDLTSEVRGVRKVHTFCNQGNLKWISPYGALRVELSYTTGGLFQACFKIQTENVKIKVSQESWRNSKFPLSRTLPQSMLIKSLFSVDGRTNEYCVTSSTPVLLYLEPERTYDMSGFPRINLEYVLERKTQRHLEDPLEECRPCDKRELIRAYCTSDFVLIGDMGATHDRENEDKTEVEFKVSRVVRKLETLFFKTDPDIQKQYGKIIVPKRCNVKSGHGTFLIAGRMRFGELTKTCSPYLADWEKTLKQAIQDETMECDPA